MPFMLYHITGESGREQFKFVRGIRLAGRAGALAGFCRSLEVEKRIPFKGHATSKKLIQLLGGSPTDQAIVLDLKPHAIGKVSLYRSLDVWGFSYANWTRLALRLRVLFANRKGSNPLALKNSFIDPTPRIRWLASFFMSKAASPRAPGIGARLRASMKRSSGAMLSNT